MDCRVEAAGAAEYPPMRATQVTFRPFVLLLAIVGLLPHAGCLSRNAPSASLAPLPTVPAVVSASTIDPGPALTRARRSLREAAHRQANIADAEAMLARAEAASAGGQALRALRLARRADALSEVAINDRFAELARAEYVELRQRTLLSEQQARDLRVAEQALAEEDFRRAYDLMAQLNQSARLAEMLYRVVRGDSLWRIAARPEIYDNGFLWPLIYTANRDRLSSPSALPLGAELDIPQHPTVAEIYQALERSGGLSTGRVAIGPIRSSPTAAD